MTESLDWIADTKVEETGPVTRKIFLSILASKVTEELEKQYRDLKKNAEIKGFRKGKAPKDLLKRYYGDQVEVEVKSSLIGQAFPEMIKANEIQLVSEPQIEKAEIAEDGTLVAEILVEVRPDVEPKEYKGFDLEREPLNILDAAIDTRLQSIREQHASSQTLEEDRPAENGDVAQIDYEGKLDGVPFDGGKADDADLELGTGSFIPGFEEGVVGMKTGETKEIEVTFPEQYQAEHLAGKTVVFTVTLKALKIKVLPELDDEFAKDLGGDFKTIQEVRDRIRKDIEMGERNRLRRQDRKKVVDALLKHNDLEVPPSVVQAQIKSMMENVAFQLRMSGMTQDQIGQMLTGSEERYQEEAVTEVKAAYIFDAIAKAEDLKLEEADIERRIEKIAEDTDRNVEAVRAIYAKQDTKARIEEEIMEDKVLDFLIENAKVTWEEPVGEGTANKKAETTDNEKE